MGQLVLIYIQSLVVIVGIELFIMLLGLPFAALHKFKSMPTAKNYLYDMLIINFLTSPIFAFSLLAITIIIRVRQI